MKNMLMNKNKRVASEYKTDQSSSNQKGTTSYGSKPNSKDVSFVSSSKQSNLAKKQFGYGRSATGLPMTAETGPT